jgi:hypothetical protein
MLDECKGDKFYEILALFSNAVLKKVLASRESSGSDRAIARRLATESMLSTSQQQSLLPLAIAHKAALVHVLRKKEEKRRRFLKFERLLNSKTENINRRIRQTKDNPQASRTAVSQKEAEVVKKQLQDNWIGEQKWLDVMLHGDQVQAENAFLGSRFDKVWRVVEAGRDLEDAAPETGLLESLQSRVSEQEARLQKWKAFHDELRNDNMRDEVLTASKASTAAQEFKFEDHLQFQLPSLKQQGEVQVVQRSTMRAEYQDVLSNMDEQLLQVSKSKPMRPKMSLTRRRTSSSVHHASPVRSRTNTRSDSTSKVHTISAWKEEVSVPKGHSLWQDAPIMPRPCVVPAAGTPGGSDATLIGYTSTLRSAMPVSNLKASPVETHIKYPEPTPPTSDPDPNIANSFPSPIVPTPLQPEQGLPSPDLTPDLSSEPPVPVVEPSPLDPEEALAEQIITSIGDATPSPVKKPQPRMSLSLVDRTRMSMARTHSFEPVPESPDLPLPPMPPPVAEVEVDRRATLLERTRLSMVAMQSRPRKSLAAKEKRKSRQSLFPVNQFDTPRTRKSFEIIEEMKSIERTPTEALFDDTVDYDRVFKSRPRIATSPVFSPGGVEASDDEEFEDGVTGIDLGDVDQDEDEDGFTKTWADSPSRRAGGDRY